MTMAGNVTAGSCQSQSIDACRSHADSAATDPAASSGLTRIARHPAPVSYTHLTLPTKA